MKIKIIDICEDCDGKGHKEKQISETRSVKLICGDCGGDGTKTRVGLYDSIADASDDYPDATSFTYL
tara:strand:+ start:130 stop:330 length:201 start_codon:yes stop_codon:yes gene_type:complete